MENPSIYHVALDDHQDTLEVATYEGPDRPVRRFSATTEPRSLRRLAKKLLHWADGRRVVCCYEAGTNGFWLQRRLTELGLKCVIVAPSRTPKTATRIKTDRRDARELVELFQAGLLTPIAIPGPADEAVRGLCRHRQQVARDLTRVRLQIGRLLQSRGLIFREGRNWSKAHRRWLWSLRMEQPADQLILEDFLVGLTQLETRLSEVEAHIEAYAQAEPYAERVGWLRCFRGIQTWTAMVLLTELHGIERFRDPRQLMSYLGLVPSEHSSGPRQRRGSITKEGNSLVRWCLVESAWHYRHRPYVSKVLRKRREAQPAEIIALADRAQHRLHKRYHQLIHRSQKNHNVVVVALARELAGFIWAALQNNPRQHAA